MTIGELKAKLDHDLVTCANDGTIRGIAAKRRGVFETIDYLVSAGILTLDPS